MANRIKIKAKSYAWKGYKLKLSKIFKRDFSAYMVLLGLLE
jgi:hypothetical protein